MNVNNLRTFVKALNALPIEVQNNNLNMMSIENPVCGTVGCHAGLVSIVARYVPELHSFYPQGRDYDYSFRNWENTLATFLGFDNRNILQSWAYNNPELWGNYYGSEIFVSGRAFGQDTDKFKHSVIIKHWTEVLERVENKRIQQNEHR